MNEMYFAEIPENNKHFIEAIAAYLEMMGAPPPKTASEKLFTRVAVALEHINYPCPSPEDWDRNERDRAMFESAVVHFGDYIVAATGFSPRVQNVFLMPATMREYGRELRETLLEAHFETYMGAVNRMRQLEEVE